MARPILPDVSRQVGYVRPSIAIVIALLAFGVFGVASLVAPAPAAAQGVNNLLRFPPRPAPPPKPAPKPAPPKKCPPGQQHC